MTREVYTNSPLEWYIVGVSVDFSEFNTWEKRWTLFALDWVDCNKHPDFEYSAWCEDKYWEASQNNGKIKRKITRDYE